MENETNQKSQSKTQTEKKRVSKDVPQGEAMQKEWNLNYIAFHRKEKEEKANKIRRRERKLEVIIGIEREIF